MKKKSFLVLSLIFEGIILITTVLLAVFLKLSVVLLVGILVADAGLIALSTVMLIKSMKKPKYQLQSKTVQLTGDLNVDIYTILGIPIQYNPDGSIKSIYELLRIHPIYDETGTRLLTPYELLGMMPRFDQNGNEVPTVFVIKNRVGKIAKVDLNKRVLTRKLTDEELEQRMIEQALKKRLEEALKENDNKTAEVIVNKLNENKAAQKKEPKKPVIKYTRETKFDKIKLPEPDKKKDDKDKKKDKKDDKGKVKEVFKPKPQEAPKKAPPPPPASEPPKEKESDGQEVFSLHFGTVKNDKSKRIKLTKEDEKISDAETLNK
ncbi:MAG: hypothetical protein IJS74_02855 [Clostridia bacterium]|nr:hypothetical protein [Clostridia bacterium]